MKYKILSVKMASSEKAGEYKRLDLATSTGETFKGVPYWNTLPEYHSLSVGSFIEGMIESTQKGAYTNHKLILANAPKMGGGARLGKELMVEKAKSIEHAQDRKAQNIDRAQSRNEVMHAKLGASEIIANHPAYKNLNDANLTYVWQNLVTVIYNFNPDSTLSPLEEDAITTMKEMDNSFHQAVDDGFEDSPF